MENKARTTCLVVGGGPAGMVLGLLVARAGVEVTVLEKHADFLRDFRGDTVHVSTLNLLDELGLRDRFAALPGRSIDRMRVQLDQGSVGVADMSRLPGPHKHIALVPQWDFLDMLADVAGEEPTFHLRRNAEVTGLLREDGRVVGARWTDRETGAEHEVRAALTVGCDGRSSAVRAASGLVPRSFGVPMDVWWFRLPRRDSDPVGGVARFSAGHFCVMIDRGDYWQCAYLIRKGTDTALRAAGIGELRRRFAALLPWMADRVDHLESFDQVSLLDVQLNRLRHWSTDGLLLIGDAAHAMSPVGGVGINLAVADAVATARIVAPELRRTGAARPGRLRRVQWRRLVPTVIVQTAQRLAHAAVLSQAIGEQTTTPEPGSGSGGLVDGAGPAAALADLPLPLRLLQRFPALQAIPARLVAVGPLPEHAPAWARRPQAPQPSAMPLSPMRTNPTRS